MYATTGQSAEERERFDAILSGRDYDREQRMMLAGMLGAERG